MKNRFLFPIILLTACFFSCQKESMTANEPMTVNNHEQAFALANKQTDPGAPTSCTNWSISLFRQNETDNTALFSGYTFTFCDNHTVTASNGRSTITGTWTETVAEVWSGIARFMTLHFDAGPADPVAVLNADWSEPDRTDDIIHLQRADGSDNIEVIFSRNG